MRRMVSSCAAAGRALVPAAVLAFTPVRTRASDEIPIGPRAIAMGSTFTAIADDASAIFWNPAGLPLVGNQEIALTHADLFGSGINNNLAAFVLPFTHRLALGADWFHTGFDDGELGFGDNRLDLAGGLAMGHGFSVGLNGKYLSRNTELDQISVRQGSGVGLDAGVMYGHGERLRVGATLQDMFDTRLNYSSGNGSAVVYERSLRVGAAWRPIRSGLVALDVDDRIHVGAEYSIRDIAILRGGIEQDLGNTGENPTWATGLGLRTGIFRFDYALSLHPELGATHHFGLAMDFNFNPSQVRIEKVETREVFASLQKDYAREPLGTARVRNLQNRPLAAQISVFAPDLMDQPTEQEVVLRPLAEQDVPLTAVISDKVIERPGDRRVPVTVSLSYQSERLPRREKRTAQIFAYGPGAIRWGGGVDQAAAYVTPEDPVVADFAREACRSEALTERSEFGVRSVAFMAAVFDALGAVGMAYVPDPNLPFSTVSQAAGAVDNVQYPRTTLSRKTGDCDDTTVLLSALFESVGIATRFVDVPGHLFLLANTGLHERNRLALGVDPDLSVVMGGQVWLPIETTAISHGFAEAWRQGADAYANWTERGRLATYGVEESQLRYEPAALPEPEERIAPVIEPAAQLSRLTADAATVGGWRRDYVDAHYEGIRSGLEVTPGALNEIAHVRFVAGETDEARRLLERALGIDKSPARSHNNLADVLVAQGDLSRAAAEYRSALSADSTDAGIWLNLGLCRDAAGDTLGARTPIARGVVLSGGLEAACGLLGLETPADVREGRPRMSAEEVRALLHAARLHVPVAADTAHAPTAHARPTRGWNLRPAGPRSASESDLSVTRFLYWKE